MVEKRKIIQEIRKDEKYRHFIEECMAIKVESAFNSAMELIMGKWELGKRIVEEELNLEKAGYGDGVMKVIAEDLDMSLSHLYKCVQFYKKYPLKDFEEVKGALPGGKNMTWYKVSQNLLPEGSDEKEEDTDKIRDCIHSKLKCLRCEKEMTLGELYEYCKGRDKKDKG